MDDRDGWWEIGASCFQYDLMSLDIVAFMFFLLVYKFYQKSEVYTPPPQFTSGIVQVKFSFLHLSTKKGPWHQLLKSPKERVLNTY